MMIALAESEIARFLESPHKKIKDLWDKNSLERTIFVDGRRSVELSHSSVFDVLRYYLACEALPDAGAEQIETWLAATDEFVEQESWVERPFGDMVYSLMEIAADFSPKPMDPETLARNATMTLSAYFALLAFLEPETTQA